jgi:hypothetical protein
MFIFNKLRIIVAAVAENFKIIFSREKKNVLFSHPLVPLPQTVHAVGVLCIVNDVVACVGI